MKLVDIQLGRKTFLQFSWKKYFYLLISAVLFNLSCHDKIPKTGWLKQQEFFSHSFWGLKIQCQSTSRIGVFWRLWWVADGRLLIVFHMAERGLVSTSYKYTNCNLWDPNLTTSPKFNYLPKAPFQISCLGVELQYMILEETQTFSW